MPVGWHGDVYGDHGFAVARRNSADIEFGHAFAQLAILELRARFVPVSCCRAADGFADELDFQSVVKFRQPGLHLSAEFAADDPGQGIDAQDRAAEPHPAQCRPDRGAQQQKSTEHKWNGQSHAGPGGRQQFADSVEVAGKHECQGGPPDDRFDPQDDGSAHRVVHHAARGPIRPLHPRLIGEAVADGRLMRVAPSLYDVGVVKEAEAQGRKRDSDQHSAQRGNHPRMPRCEPHHARAQGVQSGRGKEQEQTMQRDRRQDAG